MNLVLDGAVEVNLKKGGEKESLGRVMLKGDNITLISPVLSS